MESLGTREVRAFPIAVAPHGEMPWVSVLASSKQDGRSTEAVEMGEFTGSA